MLVIQSQSEVGRIRKESFGVLLPLPADEFKGRESFQRLEALGKVVRYQESRQMLTNLLKRVIRGAERELLAGVRKPRRRCVRVSDGVVALGILRVDIHLDNRDCLILREVREVVPTDDEAQVLRALGEGRPLGREVIAQVEKQRKIGRRHVTGGRVWKPRFAKARIQRCCDLIGGYALTRRIADVQDHVRDGAVVEAWVISREFQLPRADRVHAFKRQDAILMQIRLDGPLSLTALLVTMD